ncbi:MAG: DUF4153 domain-containing protein [Gammaproteobacteria bacterium]|nr:DUF4153 domain-containing protein [Gammaproteobacteria bacterium]MYH47165.1 DUF4153 domain-containing protein [Gammaproteobacteria bacterium]MYL12894.1 DUF4153 domain-containing protein [Gammaproteobacteria bacterium]
MNDQAQVSVRPRLALMLLISLAQGFALFLLWRATENQVWPSQTPMANFPLWTIAVALPLLLLLGLEDRNGRKTAIFVALFTALLALLGIYIGRQVTPFGEFPPDSIVATFILPLILGCFLALLFLRPAVLGRAPDYAEVFSDSWRNALVAALSWALTLGVFGIMMLWGELFRVIGIEFFIDLFTEDWFLFPVLSVAVGLGIFIFRGLANVIAGITSLLQGLMWLLLPLVLTVTVLFLGALPFTGLQPLWDTGNGTALLMALNLFALFALNAVYQRGDREPYPLQVHRVLCVGIALLPLISLLALYGLYLRVDQYGWTVARCWALLISLLITMFSLGYASNVIRNRERWFGKLASVNQPMAMLMLALVLLVNSPLLDFRKISLASQQNRVEQGEITLEQFDFFDARANMGRPAYLWMQQIIEENRDSNPELAQMAREPVRPGPPGSYSPEPLERIDFRGWVTYRPEPFAVPDALLDAMQLSIVAGSLRAGQVEEMILFQSDLDLDGNPEYVLAADISGVLVAAGFRLEEGAWRQLRLMTNQNVPEPGQLLIDGDIQVVTPQFNNLQIGDVTLRVGDP